MNYCAIHDVEYQEEVGCPDCYLEELYQEDFD